MRADETRTSVRAAAGNGRMRRLACALPDVACGSLIGVSVASLAVGLLSFLPMASAREAASVRETIPGMGLPASAVSATRVRDAERSLPPVSMALALGDADRRNLVAVVSALSDMSVPSPALLATWWTLPYLSPSGSDAAPEERVRSLVNAAYSDRPELSVYTDGQCTRAAVTVSRCCLQDSWGSTREGNLSEFAEVTERLDGVAADIADALEGDARALASAIGEDGAYAALAYDWVGRNAAYPADGDKSAHANDIYGAAIEGRSRCYGVSCALKALLDRGSIPSFVATGRADDGGRDTLHAWVVARIGGRWLAIDPYYAQEQVREGDIDGPTGGDEQVNGGVDTRRVAARYGHWFGCLVPQDEYSVRSGLELDEGLDILMGRYEELVADLEGQQPAEWHPLAQLSREQRIGLLEESVAE